MLNSLFKKNKKEAKDAKKVLTKEQREIEKNYFEAAKALEQDNIAQAHKQKSLFLKLFIGAAIVAALQAIAIFIMLPLYKVKTVVIRVDNNTGYVDVVPDIKNAKSTYSESLNRYFLSQFVINYESYDWQTVQAMHSYVRLASNDVTFSKYDNNLRSKVSPLNLFKEKNKVITKIKAVTFLEDDLATVRFTKFVTNSKGEVEQTYPVTNWIATIKFDYSNLDKIKLEQDRLKNPLGFSVLSYRVDPEN